MALSLGFIGVRRILFGHLYKGHSEEDIVRRPHIRRALSYINMSPGD
jgi:hypothetical protein